MRERSRRTIIEEINLSFTTPAQRNCGEDRGIPARNVAYSWMPMLCSQLRR